MSEYTENVSHKVRNVLKRDVSYRILRYVCDLLPYQIPYSNLWL